MEEAVTMSALLASYLMPNSADLPDVKAIIFESGEGKGPFGARGIGEPTIGNRGDHRQRGDGGHRRAGHPAADHPERLLAAIDAGGGDAR